MKSSLSTRRSALSRVQRFPDSIQATLSHDGLSIATYASGTPSRPWNPEQPVALPPYKDDEQRGHVDTRTGGIEAMSPPTLASILSSPIWLLPWI